MRCEGCHAGGPRLVFDRNTGTVRDIAVDLRARAASDHAGLRCRDCHVGRFDLFPHPPGKRDTRRCLDCHPRKETDEAARYAGIREEVAASAHGRTAGFTCEHCHDPHAFRRIRAADLPAVIRAMHDGPCVSCHEAGATGPLADPAKPGLETVHRGIVHPGLHLATSRCVDCHDAKPHLPVSHLLPKAAATPRGCTGCHGRPSLLGTRFLRLRPDPDLPLTGARILEIGHPTGAVRLWPFDLAGGAIGLLLLALFGRYAVVVRGTVDRAAAPTLADRAPALRFWHAATAASGILLTASGVFLHFGLDGPGPFAFAAQDVLHRFAGLALAVLWITAFGALAACRRDLLWFAPAPGPGPMAELRAYLAALLHGRPLPADRPVAGRFGHLQARTYGLVVFLLVPALVLTGFLLLAPERLQGAFAGLPGRSWPALAHHLSALAFGLFLLVHGLLVVAGRISARGRDGAGGQR